MEAIFGNSMAIGNFAKDSSATLGRADDEADSQDEEEEVTGIGLSDGHTTEGATSSATDHQLLLLDPKRRPRLLTLRKRG